MSWELKKLVHTLLLGPYQHQQHHSTVSCPLPVSIRSTLGKCGWWHGDVVFGLQTQLDVGWTLIRGQPGESLSLRFTTGKWTSFHPHPSIYLDWGSGKGRSQEGLDHHVLVSCLVNSLTPIDQSSTESRSHIFATCFPSPHCSLLHVLLDFHCKIPQSIPGLSAMLWLITVDLTPIQSPWGRVIYPPPLMEGFW